VFGLLDVWAVCRTPGSMGPTHVLPCGGGAAEQPAGLIDALAIIDHVIAQKDSPT
jgi:hypothetical protein